jgi:hypothetical protein
MTERMHKGDKALFTGPYVEITPPLLKGIEAGIRAHEERYEKEFPKLVAECPYETRLAVACATVKAICDHARESGTYRYLIYERMGFGFDAYAPMMFAGALDISNEFVLVQTGLEQADKHHGQAIKAAYEKLSLESKERMALVHAYLRYEELAAFAHSATEIIDRQRRELAALNQQQEPPGP